jgi:pimeloyl-ACP methyl ester carboxylesterase
MGRTTAKLAARSLAAASVVLAALAPAATADAAPRSSVTSAAGQVDIESVPTIGWGPCTDEELVAANAECGMLAVPLDWSHPNASQIQIAVSRVKATVAADRRQGVMLVNPGGPGAAGLTFATLGSAVPGGVGDTYDWIGFDPRGVGASVPALTCASYERPGAAGAPYAPPPRRRGTLTSTEKYWLADATAYATACGEDNGPLLSHMHTLDTVRDMDLMRRALGEPKINLYGFSYGSYLGQVYATVFPQRVRRMVLDGNVDPREIWYGSQFGQDRAFDIVADHLFSWIAAHNDFYQLGARTAQVRKRYYATKAALDAEPVGDINGNGWLDVVAYDLYVEKYWPEVAGAMAAWINGGDMGEMQSLYDQFFGADYADEGAAYLATECTDAPYARSYRQASKDAFTTAADAPFITWSNFWGNAPCLFWPVAADRPVRVDGRAAPPILLVNTTLDGATPYSGALEVRSRFPKARLVAEIGSTTHTDSLRGNACLDERVAAYLASGELPPRRSGRRADVNCAASRLPEPGAVNAARSVDRRPTPVRPH